MFHQEEIPYQAEWVDGETRPAGNAALHGNAQRTWSNTQGSNRKDAAETEGINEIQQTESPGMWVARDFLGNPLLPIAPPGLPDDNGGIFFNQRQELEGVTGGGTPLLANTK